MELSEFFMSMLGVEKVKSIKKYYRTLLLWVISVQRTLQNTREREHREDLHWLSLRWLPIESTPKSHFPRGSRLLFALTS